MSVYDERPWLGLYAGEPADLEPEHTDGLAMFRAGLAADPTGDAVRYFDGVLTREELDAQSDALAVALLDSGFERGDRLAVYLQNVPQFVVCLLATWKAGGVMVSINPMSRARELTYLLQDLRGRVLVALETLYDEVARDVVPASSVELVLTTSELDYQTRHDRGSSRGSPASATPAPTTSWSSSRPAGASGPAGGAGADDVAFLTYTSGTTGVPRGR